MSLTAKLQAIAASGAGDAPDAVFFFCKDGTTKIATTDTAFEPCEGCDCGWAAALQLIPTEPSSIKARIFQDIVDYTSAHHGHKPDEWALTDNELAELYEELVTDNYHPSSYLVKAIGSVVTLWGVPLVLKERL